MYILSDGKVAAPVMSDCRDFRGSPIEGKENNQGTKVCRDYSEGCAVAAIESGKCRRTSGSRSWDA